MRNRVDAAPVPDVVTQPGGGGAGPVDVLVIGSGMGGSTAAALLATAGLRVRVLEKNAVVGGVLASHRRDGFKIDRASQLVARGAKGPIGALLRELGLEQPRLLTHPIPVRSRGMLNLSAPANRRGLLATAREAAALLDIPLRDQWRLARLIGRVLLLPESACARWNDRPLSDLVQQVTTHPGAYFLFSFLASIFYVLPPWEVSAGAAMRAVRGVLRSYALSYVEGGADRLVHALLGRVVERGGAVHTEAWVRALRRDGPWWVATTSEGTEHRARAVACGLPPAEVVGLVESEVMPPAWAARARALQGSGNAHQLTVALERPLFDEGCCIGGVSLQGRTLGDLSVELMEQVVSDIAEGRCADPLAIYAPIPSNYDPTLAPAGTQLVIASIYGPTTPFPVDPPPVWRAHAEAAFERIAPGFAAATRFSEFTSIPGIGAWMGRADPCAIATAATPAQVGPGRPGVATPLPGLYLCGDGVGGDGMGIGTELAATAGREAAAAIAGTLRT